MSSCFFYKTVSIENISETSIEALSKQKQFLTLQEEGSDVIYLLENYTIENGMIIGNLALSTESDHPGNQNSFIRARGKHAKNYLHLFTLTSLEAGPLEIPISSISDVRSHEGNFIASTLATLGVITVAGVVGIVTFLAIACSCPHVATINPDGSTEFQGSLFPGSIFKSLKRKDYLVLNNVENSDEDLITVQVYNELDEIQYIDQIELLAVKHEQNHIGLLDNKNLIAYNIGELPTNAITQIDRNITEVLQFRDEQGYDFDDPAIEENLNSITLSFNTANVNEQALLVIRGQQTELLEQTAELFFQQFGSEFSTWVEKMNDKDPSNYNENAIKQGISLNAFIKQQGEWKYFGNYENVGAMAQRDLAIPIDLSGIKGEVEIKLEAAYGFWSLDMVTLTSDYTLDLNASPLELISAFNQDHEDVKKSLDHLDENHIVQALKGTSTTLKFRVTDDENSTYILSGSGYYNHERTYANAPNYKFLRKMKMTKHSTHQLAQMVRLYEDMHLASNQ